MAEPTDEITAIERVATFESPPDALWDAITDPDLLAEWFGPVELDLEPGGAITIESAEPGSEAETIGVVETVERPSRIAFVWIAPGSESPSSVELTIDPDGDGSELTVRETRIEPRWERRPTWFALGAGERSAREAPKAPCRDERACDRVMARG